MYGYRLPSGPTAPSRAPYPGAPPASAARHAFSRARPGRGFGAAPTTDPRDLIAGVGDTLAQTERTLMQVRADLVALGNAMLGSGAGPLPADAVDGYHLQRRKLAAQIVAFIERIESYAGSIPLAGGWLKSNLVEQYGDPYAWGAALLARLPPLPAGVVPNPKADFNPPGFAGPRRGFGFAPALAALAIGNPVGTAVAGVAIAGLAVAVAWGVAEIISAFNAQAQVSLAEAQRLSSWTAGQSDQIRAMQAAGFTAQQIADTLAANKPPEPPSGTGLADVLKWGSIAVGAIGVTFLIVTLAKQ